MENNGKYVYEINHTWTYVIIGFCSPDLQRYTTEAAKEQIRHSYLYFCNHVK